MFKGQRNNLLGYFKNIFFLDHRSFQYEILRFFLNDQQSFELWILRFFHGSTQLPTCTFVNILQGLTKPTFLFYEYFFKDFLEYSLQDKNNYWYGFSRILFKGPKKLSAIIFFEKHFQGTTALSTNIFFRVKMFLIWIIRNTCSRS